MNHLVELLSGRSSSIISIDRTRNPYRHGVFAPVTDEITVPKLKVVRGRLPDDIEGSYFRNGPNPVFRTSPHHWFDGDGMLHEVRIAQGVASYRNRYIRTKAYIEEEAAKQKLFRGLLELIRPKHVKTLMKGALFDGLVVKDTSHTDIVYLQKKLVSLFWLSGVPYEIDPQTLKTMGKFHIDGYTRRHISAHARVDPKTGELFCLDFSKMAYFPWVNVVCINKHGGVKWDEHFPLPTNRIFHDLLFTKNYVILMDFPVSMDFTKMRFNLFDKYESRIVLISRNDPAIKHEFRLPAYQAPYVLHGMNAFDENGVVKLTVCKYVSNPFAQDPKDLQGRIIPFVGPLRVKTRSVLWSLDIRNNSWLEESPFHDNTEFPRVNDSWLGRKGSRYSYHPVLASDKTVHMHQLVKYDWQTKRKIGIIDFARGKKARVCEEFVFIPKKKSDDKNAAEDDGYVGSMIHTVDSPSNVRSHFEIYCAHNLELVAAIETPRVPAGFHSKWVSDIVPLHQWLG